MKTNTKKSIIARATISIIAEVLYAIIVLAIIFFGAIYAPTWLYMQADAPSFWWLLLIIPCYSLALYSTYVICDQVYYDIKGDIKYYKNKLKHLVFTI